MEEERQDAVCVQSHTRGLWFYVCVCGGGVTQLNVSLWGSNIMKKFPFHVFIFYNMFKSKLA